MAKQISVFLENKAGRMAHITRVLGDANIDIRALSIADTAEFGILRLIVNDPEKAYAILRQAGFTVSETEVLVVKIPDHPGGLADVLDKMKQQNINLEYVYAFLGGEKNQAQVIFKTEDVEQARDAFQKQGIEFVNDRDVYAL